MMKKLRTFLTVTLLCLSTMAAQALGIYNVRDFGAKGDGKALMWYLLVRKH